MDQDTNRLTFTFDASRQSHHKRVSDVRFGISGCVTMVRLLPGLLWKQFLIKYHTNKQVHEGSESPGVTTHRLSMDLLRTPFRKARALIRFLHRMVNNNKQLFCLCWLCLESVASTSNRDVILYGDGLAARILCSFAPLHKLHIMAICPLIPVQNKRLYGTEVCHENRLNRWDGTVIVAAFVNIEKHVALLQQAGIARERLVLIHSPC